MDARSFDPVNIITTPWGESLGLSRTGRDLPQDVLPWVFLFFLAKQAIEGCLAKANSQTTKEIARQEGDLGLYVLSKDVGCILLRCPG